MALPITFSCLSLPTQKPVRRSTASSVPTANAIIRLLRSCSSHKEFLPIQAHLITTNLINDLRVACYVVQFLVSVKDLTYAHQILSPIVKEETEIWNTAIQNQLKEFYLQEVFLIYHHMVDQGLSLDISTFHFLIHACSRCLAIQSGREIHGRILKCGLSYKRSLNNNLMGMYLKRQKFQEVRKLFDKLSDRDVITWNTMISCYIQMGMCREALDLFWKMIAHSVSPDEVTMISLVSASTKLRDLKMGEKLHLYVEDHNLDIGGGLLNCLVDMYIKCGKKEEAHKLLGKYKSDCDVVLWTTLVNGYMKANNIEAARNLFDQMTEKSLISWTTMISGYVQGGHYRESLELFREMRFEDVQPDEVVLVTALSACSHVEAYEFGRSIHSLIMKYEMIVDGFLGNALIDLYAKYGHMDKACVVFEKLPKRDTASWNSMLDGFCRSGDMGRARAFFDEIPLKNVISWNTMLNCYSRYGQFRDLFELFRIMQSSGMKPDKLSLVSLLSCCAAVGALNTGIWVHAYIRRNRVKLDCLLGSALIDMYGKCGSTERAFKVFLETSERNVFVWTAMIAAYAREGQAQKAIDLFSEMEEMGVKPDHVTFIALLSACSHGGFIDAGYRYFNNMSSVYCMTPRIQHYGCMVDLLGRIGRLEEAVKFIESMPIEPDASIWSSLMRACGIHHKVELAEYAFKCLIEKDPLNDAAYVLLSNIYTEAGRWDNVSWARRKLHEFGVRKQPGCSMIEQDGIIHEFTAGDFSNSRSSEIYAMLHEIEDRLQEECQKTSSHHSEKLAVALGLVSSHGRNPIRVVNNLRICESCHSAMKLISSVYNREIIIRDTYRFHRFHDGSCSCNDYW